MATTTKNKPILSPKVTINWTGFENMRESIAKAACKDYSSILLDNIMKSESDCAFVVEDRLVYAHKIVMSAYSEKLTVRM